MGPAAFFRLVRAGFVLAREGAFTLVPPPEPVPALVRFLIGCARLIERRSARRSARSDRLTNALNRLGPSYVKLGQFLATRPDVVGAAVAEDLSALQDRLPPFEESLARATVAEALGRPVEQVYVAFSAPIAAASIAQVHKAEIVDADGTRRAVAVKVLRPGVVARFQADLAAFYLGARWVERLSPPTRRLRPVAIVETLARSVTIEMDLRLEAAALSEMAENIKGDPGFRVPVVDWARTAKTVLTLEWVEGRKLSDLAGLDADGVDRPALARVVIQSFLRHAVRDGFFHADMHQGNLFVDGEGTLVAVDFGIMGRLGRRERRFLAEILYGFIIGDYPRVARVHLEAGYVPPHHNVGDFAQALRAIGEPLRGHIAAEISMGRVLNQLFEVTDLFDMRTRPELILLQKTMVVVEGVARTLDPRLDIWGAADPVVRAWIERNLGPAGRVEAAAEGSRAVGRLLGMLPDAVEVLERRLAAAREDADARAGGRDPARVLGRLRTPLWLVAIALVVLALATVF
jgi:ubiquinone biosynthesis protein